MQRWSVSVFLFLMVSVLQAEVIAPGLTGQELFDYLIANYKTGSTLGYNLARDKMYGEIDLQTGNQLSCVYSGYTITISNPANPRPEVTAQDMNCEHTWPQSLGAENEPMLSDIHHLYPTHQDVNSSRGNSPFTDIADPETDIWWYNGDPYYSIPSTDIDLYSEKQTDSPERFEVREDHKGNSARSIFYFYTIYNDVADENFFQVQKNGLKTWHEQDPADEQELDRTWAIAGYQDDCPNPFVIDSTLVRRIWFQDQIPPAHDIVINEIHYNPSPAQGDDADFEFLELYNLEQDTADLSGYYFQSGIDHIFGEILLDPGEYLILAKNSATYPGSIEWDSGFLNNTGETLLLVSPDGLVADSVSFGISFPWPSEPNGNGPSLELNSPELDNSSGSNWSASLVDGGTPGLENSILASDPLIEVLSPNGAETWFQGSSYFITWISYNLTGLVKIELLKEDLLHELLTAGTEIDGSWQWDLAQDQITGSDFSVRITSLDDPDISDTSDGYFSIVEPGNDDGELFFSEYLEGSSNNKALEIFNGTAGEIDLADYQIWRANNGSTWENGFVFDLQGQISAGDVWVVCNGQADAGIQAVSDSIGGSITWFNGNDALGLAATDNGRDWYLIDVIGIAGQDPGEGWDVAGVDDATKDHTLIRKSSVLQGNINWSEAAGTDQDDSEWLVNPIDEYSDLGDHTVEMPDPPAAPENLRVEISGNTCYLSWSPVPDAVEYLIYSGNSPEPAGEWIFLASVSDTSWNTPVTDRKRFFRITAVN